LCTLAAEEFIRRFLQHAEGAQGVGQGPLLWLLQSRPAATARATATMAGRLAGSRKPATHRAS
jgi:hypothetical protein